MTSWFAERVDQNVVRKFIPYIQMHEFEGLLFSEPARLASGIHQSELTDELQEIKNLFQTPEHINDSVITAPSKRLLKLVSSYQKPLYGVLAALNVGLDIMRRECKLFDGWLRQIENLA